MMQASTAIGSVVIAAHNEEATIARCLRSLVGTSGDVRFEVVVVCNGCTDRTAAVARATANRLGQRIHVIELDEANKVRALNVGDANATAFPRLYLDADIVFERGSAADLFAALGDGVLAVAPAIRVDVAGRPWPVRAFYRIWLRRSGVERSLWGSGAYTLSAQGRQRFGSFPDLIADDLFVHERFADDERRVIEGCRTVVAAPRTTRGLLHRKARSTTGALQLHRHGDGTPKPSEDLTRHRRRGFGIADFRLLADAVPYMIISGVAQGAARRRLRRDEALAWGRDDSRS